MYTKPHCLEIIQKVSFLQFWHENSNEIFLVIFKHCEYIFEDLNSFYKQILNTETDAICFSISLNMYEHFLLPIF